MKAFNPKVGIHFRDVDPLDKIAVYKKIEKIARLCYKSEEKITDDSYVKMLTNLKNRGHFAMLEHLTFVMETDLNFINGILSEYHNADSKRDDFRKAFKYLNITKGNLRNKKSYISGSATTFRNLWKTIVDGDFYHFEYLCNFIFREYPLIMEMPTHAYHVPEKWVGIDENTLRILSNKEIQKLPYHIRRHHDYITALFRTDRGCCYDKDTKVLTNNGWKFFKDVDIQLDLIYTMDEKRDIQFIRAEKKTEEYFSGFLDTYKSTQIDLAVTPNHNIWTYDYHKRSPETQIWKFIPSKEMTNSRYGFDKSSRGINRLNKEYIDIPGGSRHNTAKQFYESRSFPANEFLRLIGIWITGGSVSYGENGFGNRIIISNTKKDIRNEIRHLLKLLNIPYYENHREFRLNWPPLFVWLINNFIKEDNAKKAYYIQLPRWMFTDLGRMNIDHLLMGIYIYSSCDGSITRDYKFTGFDFVNKSKGYQIYTASKSFAEDLVELALLTGRCANIRTVNPRIRKWLDGRISKCKEQYVVYLHSEAWHLFNNSSKTKNTLFYDDKIYCLTLPKHHKLYVMRNGKACWCGNSHEIVRHRPVSYAHECISGDTIVWKRRGKEYTVKDLYDMHINKTNSNRFELIKLKSVNQDGYIVSNKPLQVFDKGIGNVYNVMTNNGYNIKTTMAHEFLTDDGTYKRLEHLKVGDKVIMNGRPSLFKIEDTQLEKLYNEDGLSPLEISQLYGCAYQRYKEHITCCECCSYEDPFLEVHHLDHDRTNNDMSNLLKICQNCHKRLHHGWYIGERSFPAEIISIDYVGEEEVYDIEMAAPLHNYVANGFVVHNSTRYCNYNKDEDIKFIIPSWFSDNTKTLLENNRIPMRLDDYNGFDSPNPYDLLISQYDMTLEEIMWFTTMMSVELAYQNLIKKGWTPQQARSVLPNSLKTEIYVTTNLAEWEWFMKMRIPKTAHPDFRAVSIPLQEQLIELIPEFPYINPDS